MSKMINFIPTGQRCTNTVLNRVPLSDSFNTIKRRFLNDANNLQKTNSAKKHSSVPLTNEQAQALRAMFFNI